MKFQFIFGWTGLWLKKFKKTTPIGHIYEWALGLGFIEIRKWRRTIC